MVQACKDQEERSGGEQKGLALGLYIPGKGRAAVLVVCDKIGGQDPRKER